MKYFKGIPLNVEVIGIIRDIPVIGKIIQVNLDSRNEYDLSRMSFCQNVVSGCGKKISEYKNGWEFRVKDNGDCTERVSNIKVRGDYDIF